MENSPDSAEDIVNLIAKAGYLKVENDEVKVSLESSNTLNIQPKGNIFGAKVKVETNGSVTPTLTFDTKKLRERGKYTPPDKALDDALENFFEDNNV